MAFFYNPKGEVIPRAGRFDLAKNAELNIGTKDSDTFLFDKVDRDEVTVGMVLDPASVLPMMVMLLQQAGCLKLIRNGLKIFVERY